MAAMPPVSAKPAHLANHSAWRWHPLGTGVAVLHRPIPAALRGAHNGGRGAGHSAFRPARHHVTNKASAVPSLKQTLHALGRRTAKDPDHRVPRGHRH